MTREEALIKVKGYLTDLIPSEDYNEVEEIMEALEQPWIPVSKRLPSHDEYVKNNGLFNVSDGNRSYSEWFDIYETKMFGEPTISGFHIDYRVTHWMPLPEKCRVERDNEPIGKGIKNTHELADTVQLKVGWWIESKGYDKRDNFYTCSECGRHINLICGATLTDYPYCHCGAKMIESEKEMKIKFTKDFANNWRVGDIVKVKYIGQGEVLVDDVARIDLHLLLKHCVILSENGDEE